MAEKAARWRAHLQAQRASGLSIAAYCRRHGLSYAGWMYWQRRVGAAALVPIAVSSPVPAAVGLTVTLLLAGGATLRVSGVEVSDVVALAGPVVLSPGGWWLALKPVDLRCGIDRLLVTIAAQLSYAAFSSTWTCWPSAAAMFTRASSEKREMRPRSRSLMRG